MDAPFCDVIGCTAPADRFYSDGYGPVERLCSEHWNELLGTSRDRALRFEKTNPDRLKSDSSEFDIHQVRLPL